MAKIGIFTIFDETNIGNRLQNWALQHVLESMGHEVFTIRNAPVAEGPAAAQNSKAGPSREVPKSKTLRRILWAGKLSAGLVNSDGRRNMRREIQNHQLLPAVRRFNAQIRQDPRLVTTADSARALQADYDLFIAGSDQIWHPEYRKGSSNDFLAFAEPHKRVAYAASFGVAQLPEQWHTHYARLLRGMSSVSVREDAGHAIYELLTGKECLVTLDPTLLVGAEDWVRQAEKSEQVSARPYVAAYLLNDAAPQNVVSAKRFARREGLRFVNILNPSYRHFLKAGPEFFLRAIRDAEHVVTDSFHATVFSIVFGRPVTVFSRGKMNDRVDTLLRTCSADPHAYREIPQEGLALERVIEVAVLDGAKTRSMTYLRDSIEKALI